MIIWITYQIRSLSQTYKRINAMLHLFLWVSIIENHMQYINPLWNESWESNPNDDFFFKNYQTSYYFLIKCWHVHISLIDICWQNLSPYAIMISAQQSFNFPVARAELMPFFFPKKGAWIFLFQWDLPI